MKTEKSNTLQIILLQNVEETNYCTDNKNK